MSELHTQEAQAQMVKEWWAKYGTVIITGLIIVILAVSGHRFWMARQANIAAKASLLYDEYQLALNTHNDESLLATYSSLKKDYKRTPYASAVVLIESARDIQSNKYKEAEENLLWVIEQGHDYAKPIARLRLSELKLQQKDYQGAEDLLKHPADPAYVPPYDEMLGDIYFAQGKIAEAIDQYTKSLKGYKDLGFDNILLQYKIQSYAPKKVAEAQQ